MANQDLIKPKSQWKIVWRRFKKSRTAMIGLFFVVVILLSAIFADVIAPYDYAKQNYSERLQYPSKAHIMGTDNFGRDLFSRLIHGGRVSLGVALISVTISLTIGGFLGATASFFGGTYEALVMRLCDGIMAIPTLMFAISISAVLGNGIITTALAISLGAIPRFTRITRASVLTVKGQEYIEAARSVGSSNTQILLRHIIPNALAPIFVQVTLNIVNAILLISQLTFVGLGIQPPTPEWGSILNAGREYIRTFWPIVTFPGVMIMITLMSFNMMGDGLRDALDPRLKQ